MITIYFSGQDHTEKQGKMLSHLIQEVTLLRAPF